MIGGNKEAVLQVQAGFERNSVGTRVPAWVDVPVTKASGEKTKLTGWLDLQAGDSKRTTYFAKIQESTHIFVGDYVVIPSTLEVEDEVVEVTAETARLIVDSQRYDVMLIDDPMGMHKQLEIYLKYTGGQ